jgi:hypothetical protein
MGRRIFTDDGSLFVAITKTGYITQSRKKNKSCKLCIHFQQMQGYRNHCRKFNINISSLNNATHCKGYERN